MDWILTVIGWLLAPVCSALVVALTNQRQKTKKEKERAERAEKEAAHERESLEKARVILAKASARKNIIDAYKEYILGGKPLSVARYEELIEEYEAYRLLGGNGTAKKYMEEIMAQKPYVSTD